MTLTPKLAMTSVINLTDLWDSENVTNMEKTLIDFVIETEFIIANTFFKHSLRRLYICKSLQDTPDYIVRNQIEYIMVNKRFRNFITSMKT